MRVDESVVTGECDLFAVVFVVSLAALIGINYPVVLKMSLIQDAYSFN